MLSNYTTFWYRILIKVYWNGKKFVRLKYQNEIAQPSRKRIKVNMFVCIVFSMPCTACAYLLNLLVYSYSIRSIMWPNANTFFLSDESICGIILRPLKVTLRRLNRFSNFKRIPFSCKKLNNNVHTQELIFVEVLVMVPNIKLKRR